MHKKQRIRNVTNVNMYESTYMYELIACVCVCECVCGGWGRLTK